MTIPASVQQLPKWNETMGLIWDLIQHSQISETQNRASSLEQRVVQLENELQRTNEALIRLLRALEKRFGEDLDSDGRVG